MKTTFIYKLTCPVSKTVRYVGKSDNPVKRLYHHLNDNDSTKKYHWIKELKSIGLVPSMGIIKEVPVEEWPKWEKFYIAHYIGLGFSLVNSTHGGGYSSGKRRPGFKFNSSFLRILVEKTGKTKNMLSKEIGVDHGNFHKLISGKFKCPSFDTLCKITEYFSIQLSDLVI